MSKVQSLVGFAMAFVEGLVPAFFVNLNSVFSDCNGSLNELLSIFVLIGVSYLLLGLAFGFFGGVYALNQRNSYFKYVF